MKKILFIANNATALSGMLFIIEKIKEEYDIIPVLLCEHCYYETEEFEVINLTPDYKEPPVKFSINEYFNADKKKILYQIMNFIVSYKSMRQDDKKSREYLKDNKFDGIVIYCDRMGGILQGFIKNKGDIPVIMITIGLGGQKGLFDVRRYNLEVGISDNKYDINRLAKKINPKWAYAQNGEEVLFYSLGKCIAGYFCKMISMNPWVDGGGGSTHVLVRTNLEKDRIEKCCDKEVIVTGLVEDYYILKSKNEEDDIRKFLNIKYNIGQERIVILCMPQMAEHGMVPWDIHRKNMIEIVKCITEVYGKFLVSLHPKSRKEDYTFLLEHGKFEFLDERFRDVVSGSDVVIAVETSSIEHLVDVLSKKKVILCYEWLLNNIEENMIIEIKKDMRNVLYLEEKQKYIQEIKCVPRIIMDIINKSEGN